jgi:hypothetical protein
MGNHTVRTNTTKTDRKEAIIRVATHMEGRRHTMMTMEASHTKLRKKLLPSLNKRTLSQSLISLPNQRLSMKMNM